MSGFHVPSGLVERGADGLELIRHVQLQWMRKDRGATNSGQVAFAAWIMRNPANAARIDMSSSIIERLLTGELLPSEPIAAMIERETASSVMHDAWANMSFRAGDGEPARKGDDAAEKPPRAVSSPQLVMRSVPLSPERVADIREWLGEVAAELEARQIFILGIAE